MGERYCDLTERVMVSGWDAGAPSSSDVGNLGAFDNEATTADWTGADEELAAEQEASVEGQLDGSGDALTWGTEEVTGLDQSGADAAGE
jgi:hypothetical protein